VFCLHWISIDTKSFHIVFVCLNKFFSFLFSFICVLNTGWCMRCFWNCSKLLLPYFLALFTWNIFPVSVAKLRPPLTTTLPPTAVPSADSNLTAEGTISSGSSKEEDSVLVTYTLWVGTNVTENFTINVMARRNSSFYHVMQIAAEQDPRYAWVFQQFVLFKFWIYTWLYSPPKYDVHYSNPAHIYY